MSVITGTMSESFDGWGFDDTNGDLLDPAGNRYRPIDLLASYWMRQAWSARAGAFPEQIAFMKATLEERIRDASYPLVVEVHQERPDGRVMLGSLRIGGGNPQPGSGPVTAVKKRAA
jgi:hypothetical protein